MHTLSNWVNRLSKDSLLIECPKMSLYEFFDNEDPIFEGPGHLEFKERGSIQFTIHAVPRNPGDAFRKIAASRNSPYEVEKQFRLKAVDYEETEWSCGWTSPMPNIFGEEHCLLSGYLTGLSTDLSGNLVSDVSSVELVFPPGPFIPFGESLIKTASIGQEEVSRQISGGRQRFLVLGSEIEVVKEPWSEDFWIIATTSNELPHPYLESWLSEPLRVLCGKLVYPRLVARNFGDGRAFVQILPAPASRKQIPGYASQFFGKENFTENFWEFYKKYLIYISKRVQEDDEPNLEANEITRFYEEIIQAAPGSRWVLSLTLASSVEGIVKKLASPKELVSDFLPEDVDSIQEHVKTWTGHPGVQKRILWDISRLRQRTINSYLGKLVDGGVISKQHREAWNQIRNRVMHGELGTPWSDESTDKNIERLLELIYILIGRLVGDK